MLAIAVGGCWGKEKQPMNLVLIIIDALRPDHLGCYGYPKATSVNLDQLAQDGYQFKEAIANAPYTMASVPSILTGTYQYRHGIRYQPSVLSSANTTLTEILASHGYKRAAFVANPLISHENGFDQGFEFFHGYDELRNSSEERISASLLTQRAIEWLKGRPKGPFFLLLFYFDTHWPYEPPEPFDGRFDPDFHGEFTLYRDWEQGKVAIEDIYFHNSLSLREVSHIQSLYDGCIASVDSEVGVFWRALEKLGLQGDTLLVITSDHGESLGEHGLFFTHGFDLYDTLVRVPLIIRLPGERGRKIEEQVRLIDILPTTLDLLGIEAKASFDGVSLKPLMKARAFEPLEAYGENAPIHPGAYRERPRMFLEGTHGAWQMLRLKEWKLIRIPDGKDDQYELYDLKKDPEEQDNLFHERTDVAQRLKKRLLELSTIYNQKPSEERVAPIDEEARERLKSMGYIH